MQQNDIESNDEFQHAKDTLNVINKCIDREVNLLKNKRDIILDQRKYFIDYFYELQDDEKRDLMQNEYGDMKAYEYSSQTISRLGKQLNDPYFARIDFKEDGEEEEKFYIGINSITHPVTGAKWVYDWRAPISSLYYETEKGIASFKAPMGPVNGVLSLKRRYVFKKGVLKKFNDIGMPSDDEMLVEVLSENSDEHMKTIVSTLQREQNKIIRDYIEGVSVISGCPGSGKTSIALHKAAYILYQFKEKLQNQRLVVLSPNDVFAEYISTVLPDLGEDSIDTINPEEILTECIKEYAPDINFLSREQSQEKILICEDEKEFYRIRDIGRFKTSMRFREVVLSYIQYLNENIFIAQDLYLDEEEVCKSAEQLNELFYHEYYGEPLFNRTEMIADLICTEKKITSFQIHEYIKNELSLMMKSEFVSELYVNMFENGAFIEYAQLGNILEGMAPTDNFTWDDGCACAMMCISFYGTPSDTTVFYLIADEAQDFSPIFLEILNKHYRGCNMLFVGDKNQLVFDTSGNYCEEIQQVITKKPFRSYDLHVNYRSTREIMALADKICGGADVSSCVRSGAQPLISCSEDLGKDVSEYLISMYNSGYENMAVLCKTKQEAVSVMKEIKLPPSIENMS